MEYPKTDDSLFYNIILVNLKSTNYFSSMGLTFDI